MTEDKLILHYQPKLNLKTLTITGVEALIRWEDPKLGLVNPLAFMATAEETGHIIQIGEWILAEACRTNKQWQSDGYQPISMSVNLSPKQFHHPQTTAMIEKVLQETQLDPRYLDIEITEMTIMDDVKAVNTFLNHLKSLGITLSVDDFGTGHTSVQYLKDFPINTLKIDQSYIKSIPDDQHNMAITSGMIALAHQLGMQVVAEGVETKEQLQFLTREQCDLAQGYLIGRPVPASELVAQLSR